MRLSFIRIVYATCAIAIPMNNLRSGILGLGDSGGSNRDESDNQNLVLFGDDFMSGKSNTFAPEASISGIDGVGTSHIRD